MHAVMGRALKGRTPILERGAAPAARRAAGPGEARPGQAPSACQEPPPLTKAWPPFQRPAHYRLNTFSIRPAEQLFRSLRKNNFSVPAYKHGLRALQRIDKLQRLIFSQEHAYSA